MVFFRVFVEFFFLLMTFRVLFQSGHFGKMSSSQKLSNPNKTIVYIVLNAFSPNVSVSQTLLFHL